MVPCLEVVGSALRVRIIFIGRLVGTLPCRGEFSDIIRLVSLTLVVGPSIVILRLRFTFDLAVIFTLPSGSISTLIASSGLAISRITVELVDIRVIRLIKFFAVSIVPLIRTLLLSLVLTAIDVWLLVTLVVIMCLTVAV